MINFIFLIFSQSTLFVEPPRIEKVYLKGRKYVETIQIEIQNFPAHIEIYVEDFTIDEEGKVKFEKEGTFNFSLSPFIKIVPRSFDIEKGERKEVRILINLPDTINSYEKWCMIIVRAYPKIEKTPRVFVVGEIGVPVYGMFENPLPVANLINIDKEKDKIYFLLENLSPVHIRVNGKAFILNEENEKILEEDISNLVILPLKKRKFYFEIKGNPHLIKKGKYKFLCQINYGGEEDLVGEKEIELP
ncbi:MAG: hypothetical protein ABIM29_05905 [candidate division WOR-3 bacterium]